MSHRALKKQVMDALFLYTECRLWGSKQVMRKKRDEFERLRDIYETQFGKLFKRQ